MGSNTLTIDYNVNGIGVINSSFYGLSSELFQDKLLNVQGNLKNINQLGAIRFIHNGAHYTRYEYVLLQIMLINFIKDEGMKLGAEKDFRELLGDDKDENELIGVTAAELLQLIVIFGNMGYFKDTFSSNKVWFHILKTNKYKAKTLFRSGMRGESRHLLDLTLENSDFQRLQWLNTLYIFSRNNKFNKYRVVCEGVLVNILNLKRNQYFLINILD